MHNLLLYSFGKSKGPTAKQIQSLLRGLSSSKLMETKFPMFKFLIFKVYFPLIVPTVCPGSLETSLYYVYKFL